MTTKAIIGETWHDSVPEAKASRDKRRGRPNILFYMLDDVGFSDLGCYGSEIETPAFDRLAKDGITYNNFHVTAMCSPSRACLMTGRNAHHVGMGIISEWCLGYPGYRGYISENAATIAELLRDQDYATWLVGKWHLTPNGDLNATGPFKNWPLGRGFDRWYGFHTSYADHWHPELTEDNRYLDAPSNSDYFLTTDMTDNAIRLIRQHASTGSDRPFFLYTAPGACHWPHHAPPEALDRFRGRYDEGWTAIRQARLRKQKALGVVPENTRLPPMNPDVVDWDDMTDVQRRFAARLQEAYAAFLHHTDAEFGRMITALEETEQLQDTIIVCLSDNGASPEGGAVGTLDNRKHRLYGAEDDDERLRGIDRIGSATAFNHYPMGWAQTSNTPLKWYKKDTHGGGVRSPLIVHWPEGLKGHKGWRPQFHHIADIVPTMLDIIGAEMPDNFAGKEQIPMDGVSMSYSFADAAAPTQKDVQYFELFGDRALWKDGWKAVTHHLPGEKFDEDKWELYRLEDDFSECSDLSEAHPDIVAELRSLWWQEAKRNFVLPLDDREAERIRDGSGPFPEEPLRLYPDTPLISRMELPDMTGPWIFQATLVVDDPNPAGVVMAIGGHLAGFSLFINDAGQICFDYRYSFEENFELTCQEPLQEGETRIVLSLDSDGTQAKTTLSINERKAGELDIPRCWKGIALVSGLCCGHDPGAPVSPRYQAPFPLNVGLTDAVLNFPKGSSVSDEEKFRALIDEH